MFIDGDQTDMCSDAVAEGYYLHLQARQQDHELQHPPANQQEVSRDVRNMCCRNTIRDMYQRNVCFVLNGPSGNNVAHDKLTFGPLEPTGPGSPGGPTSPYRDHTTSFEHPDTSL